MKPITAALAVILVVAAGFFLSRAGWFGEPVRPIAPVPEGAEENDPTLPASAKRPPGLEAQLVGEWRSLEDTKFTRVFAASGQFHDTYGGDPAGAPGTWELATNGSEELWLHSEGDTMRFRVVESTATALELTYLDRGNTLRFERVK